MQMQERGSSVIICLRCLSSRDLWSDLSCHECNSATPLQHKKLNPARLCVLAEAQHSVMCAACLFFLKFLKQVRRPGLRSSARAKETHLRDSESGMSVKSASNKPSPVDRLCSNSNWRRNWCNGAVPNGMSSLNSRGQSSVP